MKIIGIHIEKYGVYSIQLQPASKQPVLLAHEAFPLSLDLDEDQRKVEIANHLKELTQKYPPQHHCFVFSIPQKQVSVHNFKFPFQERFKINKALPYEMEEKMPFSLEKVVHSSKISHIQDQFSYVLNFVSPKSSIQNFLDFIKTAAKIQPLGLIPESSALINLFENWQSSPPHWKDKKTAAVQQLALNLSYECSTALVLSQNRVIYTYDLNWSLAGCIEEISVKYRRSADQALDYFFKNAFITQKEEGTHLAPLLKTIKSRLSSLIHQMHLLFIHLKGAGHDSIQDIHILGPGSAIQNLPAYLFQAFKIPVHIFQKHDLYEIPSQHWAALGTALEGCKRPKNPPVNFIESFQTSSGVLNLSQKKKKIFQSLFLIFISCFTYVCIRNWQSSQLLSQIDPIFSAYSRKIAGLKTRNISVKSVKSFLRQKQEAAEKSKIYRSIPAVPSAMDLLKRMSLSLNQNDQWKLELTQFEIKGYKVIMQGFILKEHIPALQSQLKLLAVNGRVKNISAPKKPNPQPSAADPDNKSEQPEQQPAELQNTAPFHFTFNIKT